MAVRHFIEPGSFSLAEQLALLDLADRMEADPAPYAHLCDGRILATLFYEPSTRTRLSFESAMLRQDAGLCRGAAFQRQQGRNGG
jgi:aspartate carbamoyltransferase catalytic subunit